MANLVIDIGNTRTKVAVFNNREISHYQVFEKAIDEQSLNNLIGGFNVSNSIISSVRTELSKLEHLLKKKTNYIRFSALSQRSVKLTYQTPQTLGLDRLAAIIGAASIYPNENSLVIDAGTCITYDAIDSEKVFSGGSISPGLNMRFEAMHRLTGRLPLIKADEAFSDWQGHDTISAMQSGVLNGSFSEVMGFIETYSSRYSDLKILLCGGDAKFFDTRLKNSIFAHAFKTEPHLVLIGLNEVIYPHND